MLGIILIALAFGEALAMLSARVSVRKLTLQRIRATSKVIPGCGFLFV
jgi:hypothetical protein